MIFFQPVIAHIYGEVESQASKFLCFQTHVEAGNCQVAAKADRL